MLKIIDSKSSKTVLPELDLHSIPPSQIGVLDTRWVQVPLKNSLLPNGPWEFQLTSNSRSFLNLKKSWIVFTFKITDKDGKKIPLEEKDKEDATKSLPNPLYAPCQGIASSIVRQYTLHINSQLVYDSSVNHAYKTYMENALNFDKDRKSSLLELEGWRYETVMDSEAQEAFKSRAKLTEKGQSCQLAAPISIDLFNQDRLLLNFTDVRLTAYPNSDKFLIDSFGAASTEEYKFVVEDVHLLCQEWDLADGYIMSLEKKLAESNIQYPMTSVQMRQFFIQEGRMDAPVNTLFTTHCPKRIIVGMVEAAAFNGEYKKSPFNFKHFDLQNIYLDFNGKTIPSRPLALDYENNKFAHAYLNMIEGLGMSRSEASNGITMSMFKTHFNFYVFDISPTANNPDVFDMIRQSNLSCRLEFKKPVPSGGLYCLVLGEFDTILSLDAQRNPHFDSII